ncbi:hypothetical protein LTR42_003650 [Elasticomyces elasticus]|nr:hypothetical protein LTR42_003650 [Elasticomyces elasticus]
MVGSVDKLKGKKVVVVGGTSGIGHGAALALLEHGAHVTIISSSEQRVKSVVEDVGDDKLHGRVANVREEEDFIEVLRSLAPIDHLVFSGVDKVCKRRVPFGFVSSGMHSAVGYPGLTLSRSSEAQLPKPTLTNAGTSSASNSGEARSVVRRPRNMDIINPGGSLTLTSGTGAMNPGKTASIGGALNAGLFTMTQGLALELADKRIRVNCVVPGIVATELWDKMGTIGSGDEQNQKLKAMGEKLPVGFCATGEDIAEAYLYAIRANYATGTLITIDGGGVLK